MTKYVKQKDKYNCGPVAILNIAKWAGEKTSYKKEWKHLKTVCKSIPPFGTDSKDLSSAIKKRLGKYFYEHMESPTLSKINLCLDDGGAVIVKFSWWSKGEEIDLNQYAYYIKPASWTGHYVAIIGRTKNGYLTCNFGSSVGTLYSWPKRSFRHYLGNDGCGKPDAWFFTKG